MADPKALAARDAIVAMIDAQIEHIQKRDPASLLYGVRDGRSIPMELVIGRMEAQVMVDAACAEAGKPAPHRKELELSIITYRGMPVIVEGPTGVKVRGRAQEERGETRRPRHSGVAERLFEDAARRDRPYGPSEWFGE